MMLFNRITYQKSKKKRVYNFKETNRKHYFSP